MGNNNEKPVGIVQVTENQKIEEDPLTTELKNIECVKTT